MCEARFIHRKYEKFDSHKAPKTKHQIPNSEVIVEASCAFGFAEIQKQKPNPNALYALFGIWLLIIGISFL
jgi:hypothetical protein